MEHPDRNDTTSSEKVPRFASRRLLSGAILLTLVFILVALGVVALQPTSPSWDDVVQSKGFLQGERISSDSPTGQRATKVGQFTIDVEPYLSPRNYSLVGEAHDGEDVTLPLAQKPLCSPDVFREYYRSNGYFPSAGAWTPGLTFIPNICKFGFNLPLKSALQQCFAKRNIKSIVIFGASQAQRYTRYLKDYIKMGFPKCKVVKVEKQIDRLPQASYYGIPDGTDRLIATRRHCSGCASYKAICSTSSGSSRVSVEYFGMDDLLDSTLRLYTTARENSIETYQEFIFHKYLAPNPPDLIIISPAANHMKFKSKPAKIALDVNYFQSLIKIYLPNTTRTLWMTGTSEHELAQFRNANYKGKTFDGLLATEAIDRLNHIIFEVNKDKFLDSQSGVLGFLDLVSLSQSCPVAWWNKLGGVHMMPVWYKTIALYLISYICA